MIKKMSKRARKLKEEQKLEAEDTDLMTGLENTLRVMTVNATEMIKTLEVSRGLMDAQRWAKREKFCSELTEMITARSSITVQDDNRCEGGTLGQSNALLYGR
jgi:hypothetical protein